MQKFNISRKLLLMVVLLANIVVISEFKIVAVHCSTVDPWCAFFNLAFEVI